MGFPIVLLTPEQDKTLSSVIQQAGRKFGECSWLGVGKPGEFKGEWVITQLLFPEQENTKSRTDMDDDKLAELQLKIAPKWEEDERIIWWGHSHGDMGVFYSGTDYDTWWGWIHREPEFFLGTCHNLKGEVYTRLNLGPYDLSVNDTLLDVRWPKKVDKAVGVAMDSMTKPFVQSYKGTGWTGYGTTINKPKVLTGKEAMKAANRQDDIDWGDGGWELA